MKQLNSEKLTREFNTLRQQNQEKIFSPKELEIFLNTHGFSINIINRMKIHNVFICERIGTSKFYSFRSEPLYKGKMEEIIRDFRISIAPKEESAINLLKSKGYSLKVCRGFDLTRFASENPELYQKYLIYEEV